MESKLTHDTAVLSHLRAFSADARSHNLPSGRQALAHTIARMSATPGPKSIQLHGFRFEKLDNETP